MDKLIVSSSPHIRGKDSTTTIMRDVLIALAPCVIAGIVYFGFNALLVVAVTTATAIFTEYVSDLTTVTSNVFEMARPLNPFRS